MGAGGVGGAEDEVGAIAAEERLDSREGLHQVGAVVVSVVEHNNKVPGIRHCLRVAKCLQIFFAISEKLLKETIKWAAVSSCMIALIHLFEPKYCLKVDNINQMIMTHLPLYCDIL